MPLTPQQIEAFVDAQAAVLDLRLASAHRPGVVAFFTLAAGLSERVMGLPLAIEDEPAAVFTPVAPRKAPE
jgi:Protein of unknown function (DUF4089)